MPHPRIPRPSVARITPGKLTEPYITKDPAEFRLYKVKFSFAPNQSFRHFWFLFSNNLPQSHAWEHYCFCRFRPSCPFHS